MLSYFKSLTSRMYGLIVLEISLAILGLYLIKDYFTSRRKNLPPGPRSYPFIGNLFDLPKNSDWLHWAKHKDLYGSISSVNVFGRSLVIINDIEIALDLFETKSLIYSDRPTSVFAGEMCGWANTTSILQYGKRFRAHRKIIHQLMGSKHAVALFFPLEEVETRRFLSRVASSPDKLPCHIRKMAGAIILKILHGYTIDPEGSDPLVDLAETVTSQVSMAMVPGAWLVDLIPTLRIYPDWLPGSGFKRTAREWNKTLTEFAEKPHAFVRQQMASGCAPRSYMSTLLEEVASEDEENIVKFSAAALYAGGTDTTVSSIYSFYLAMILFPKVQRKAQAEIDAVTGGARLPNFDDRPRLPYIEAIVKEVLRWRTVVPMGVPHVNSEDDVYKGYFIPKGSILMSNIWQMTHDPSNFHEPMEFKPERFLGVDGRAPEMDTHKLSFGFGRRICPGKELADSSIFIAIAMSLAVFNVAKCRDENGAEIEPLDEVTSGIGSRMKEFKCSITLRSAKATALVYSVDKEHPVLKSDADVLANLDWERKF